MFDFDIRFVPGEAASNLDWTKIQKDFDDSRPQLAASAESISRMAPLYPVFQSAIWEIPAVQQILAALDECYVARQQTMLLGGEAQGRAQLQLRQAEHELGAAKEALIQAMNDLQGNASSSDMLNDLEAAWESNLIHPGTRPAL